MAHDELELLFLGTGTSSAIPSIGCLTSPDGCYCCKSTLDLNDPAGRKNIRKNTSAVLRIPSKEPGGRKKSLLIDVSPCSSISALVNPDRESLHLQAGKTFYQASLEQWPKKGLREIDALLITHAHAVSSPMRSLVIAQTDGRYDCRTLFSA